MSEAPLLVTKFSAPPVRAPLMQRESLIELLNQGCALPLVLLSASAGFGKTTLLSAWVRQSTQKVSWLSLDEQDNDPERFWVSVIATLKHSGARLDHMTGEAAFAQLHNISPPQLSGILVLLLNALTAEAVETTLILDDYHVIEDQAIHASLVFVLEHAPSCFHLVLSSRVDPPLSLSRWRARRQLIEIRDADLRLSEAETGNFLSQVMSLRLGEQDAQRLAQRTEGWIVGVQLAALALRGQKDPSAWILAFSGSQRFIMDYVRDEILKPQPASVQQFLLQTAVLTEMNAALCQILTGEQASQELLEFLEQANLFVVPLDEERRWYRFHPLFREALLTCLRVTEPELMPHLYQRAATWYATQERWSSAIPYAFEAEDPVLAADLIEHFIASQSWHHEYHTLRRWLARLPREILRSRPDLSFMYVFSMVLTSQRGPHTLELVEEPLQWAEQSYREAANQTRLGDVLTIRAVLTTNQGDFAHAFALARDALRLLPEHDPQWRWVCLIIQGTEAALNDQGALAKSLLLQGLALSESGRWLPSIQIATAMLGDVSLARGELRQAAHYFQQTLATSDEREALVRFQLTLETGARETHYEWPALYGLAALSYELNQLEEAERYLQKALSQGQSVFLHILTPGLLLQVRLLFVRGEVERAREHLGELAVQVHRSEVLRAIQLCQAWLAFKLGDKMQVRQWAASYQQAPEPLALIRREEEILLLARLHIAEGQPQMALDALAPWKGKASESGRLYSELQILMLEVLAYAESGARDLARATLLEVVTRARQEGFQRLFLDEGEVIETLLKTLLPDLREKALVSYVRTLLYAFAPAFAQSESSPGSSAALLLDPLTPQEQRVLHLLAAGASNQDIADTLVVSLATARKHVSNILSKLDATNRTQAIARAREYALL